MENRVATNIRMERETLRELKRIAVDGGRSLSKVFEEMVADYLGRTRAFAGRDWRKDPFFRIGSRRGGSGRRDVAAEHDKYLYGTSTKRR
jgi:hypothetical protein